MVWTALLSGARALATALGASQLVNWIPGIGGGGGGGGGGPSTMLLVGLLAIGAVVVVAVMRDG